MTLPFDGAISAFYASEAPADIRAAIDANEKGPVLGQSYPYAKRMKARDYEETLYGLQLELAKLLADVRETGKRVLHLKMAVVGKNVTALDAKVYDVEKLVGQAGKPARETGK